MHETKFSLKISYSKHVCLAQLDKHLTWPVMVSCEFNSHWRQYYVLLKPFKTLQSQFCTDTWNLCHLWEPGYPMYPKPAQRYFCNHHLVQLLQGLSVPFACIGSSDPVRVLRLYTTNTLDILWSIYCWDICTTCRYQCLCATCSSLTLWDFLLADVLRSSAGTRMVSNQMLCLLFTLYCVVVYIPLV